MSWQSFLGQEIIFISWGLLIADLWNVLGNGGRGGRVYLSKSSEVESQASGARSPPQMGGGDLAKQKEREVLFWPSPGFCLFPSPFSLHRASFFSPFLICHQYHLVAAVCDLVTSAGFLCTGPSVFLFLSFSFCLCLWASSFWWSCTKTRDSETFEGILCLWDGHAVNWKISEGKMKARAGQSDEI